MPQTRAVVQDQRLELDGLAVAGCAARGPLGLCVELALLEPGVPDIPDAVVPILLGDVGTDLLVDRRILALALLLVDDDLAVADAAALLTQNLAVEVAVRPFDGD